MQNRHAWGIINITIALLGLLATGMLAYATTAGAPIIAVLWVGVMVPFLSLLLAEWQLLRNPSPALEVWHGRNLLKTAGVLIVVAAFGGTMSIVIDGDLRLAAFWISVPLAFAVLFGVCGWSRVNGRPVEHRGFPATPRMQGDPANDGDGRSS